MISEEMLSLLAKAIAQKSKSFLRYGELVPYLSDHYRFRQALVEIILREQKHFEALSEIISQLIKGEEHRLLLELMTGNVDDDNKREKRKEVLSDIGDTGRIDTVLLNRLVKTKRSLSSKDNLGSAMSLEVEKKNIGENNMEETQLFAETPSSEEARLYSPVEINIPFQQEGPSEQCTPEQYLDVSSSKESELLVWTFGRPMKKGLIK